MTVECAAWIVPCGGGSGMCRVEMECATWRWNVPCGGEKNKSTHFLDMS